MKTVANTLLLIGLLWIVGTRILVPGANIQPDSRRYVAAGLNIYEHGVLSGEGYKVDQAPEPGLYAGGVFTALEIALAASISTDTYRDLVCVAMVSVDENCGQGLWALKGIYYFETVVFHLCVFVVGYLFFGCNLLGGWMTAVISLTFYDTFLYASSPLSEQGYLMLGGLFMASWAHAYERLYRLWPWALSGGLGGFLVLVKPAWLLLPLGLSVLPIIAFFIRRDDRLHVLKASLVFFVAFVLAVTPLIVRNALVLETFSMSQTSYLVSSLSHRFAFNLMSWREWLIGWIYYLPLSGAQRLFGADALVPLGWDAGSYYEYGRDVLDKAANDGRTDLEARGYLLSHFVFEMPLKFVAVTALLLWRGIFVGHIVGMLAVPCVVTVMVFAESNYWRKWVFIFLPPFFMAGVNAALSVSLYRYNLAMIIPYCLAMVWVALTTLNFLISRRNQHGFLATAKTFLPATR